MPDRNDLPGSWLATFVALAAVGVGTSHAQQPLPAAVTPTGSPHFAIPRRGILPARLAPVAAMASYAPIPDLHYTPEDPPDGVENGSG